MATSTMTGYVCAAAVAVLAWGATASAQGVEFGVKGGLVRTTLATSGVGQFDTSARSGATVGVSLAMPAGSTWRFQPEVLFGSLQFGVEGTPAEVTVSGRAVEVPLLVHARFGGGRAHPLIYAGPQLTFISGVTQSTDGFEEDISDQVANVDVGLAVGAGLESDAGRGAVTVEARFNWGLRNVNENENPGFKSRAFQLLFGYRF